MAMKEPSKVLDDKIRGLLERYESLLSEAFDQVTETFSENVEPLVEQFGAPAVAGTLRHYAVTVRLPKNLAEAFGPAVDDPWQDEWKGSW